MPAQTRGLAANLSLGYGSLSDGDLTERRSAPRITTPFPATLRGVHQAAD